MIRTAILKTTAWMARKDSLKFRTDAVMKFLGRSVVKSKGINAVQAVEALGREWQKAFPDDGRHPVIQITDDTVFAEIHTDCPLRGTGDFRACHRLMAFDRTVLEHAGGNFVVLESQAQPGVTVCKVGMRLKGAGIEDLKPVYTEQLQRGAR